VTSSLHADPVAARMFFCYQAEGVQRLMQIAGNQGTFDAPGVGVELKAQSADALSLSVPSGRRASDPLTVLESATDAERAVPSTRLRVPVKPLMFAAVIAPS